MARFRSLRQNPDPDTINMMLEAATSPSWHLRHGGWAVWSFEHHSPVYDFVMMLNRLWASAKGLPFKLMAIRPFLPEPVYKRVVVYASLRFAQYIPPLQFREDIVVEVNGAEATVVLPEPTSLTMIVPAPPVPAARILHLFLNYPTARGQPVGVLTVWVPTVRMKHLSYALPRGKPTTTIRKLASVLMAVHPEDLGVIGPWDPLLLAAYLTYVADIISAMTPDALISSIPGRRK